MMDPALVLSAVDDAAARAEAQRAQEAAYLKLLTNKNSGEVIVESHRPFDESEKTALAQIYEACGGPAWARKGRWLSNPEPNFWHGVVVEDGKCTKLMLPNNNLTGCLPDVFASLPHLKCLCLTGNQLSGAIPASLGGLSRLEVLDLSRNAFAGAIPRSLGGLFSLRRMLLDHNQLDGDVPSTLGCLLNLKCALTPPSLSPYSLNLAGEGLKHSYTAQPLNAPCLSSRTPLLTNCRWQTGGLTSAKTCSRTLCLASSTSLTCGGRPTSPNATLSSSTDFLYSLLSLRSRRRRAPSSGFSSGTGTRTTTKAS